MIKQKTISNSIKSCGVGIHTGKNITMKLHSAPVDTGIVFRRVDLNPVVEISALAGNVTDTTMSTRVSNGGVGVGTTEHLMSALSGMGVDNCYIDIDGPEVPIMDGSAWNFVFLLRSAGIVEQEAPKKFLRILKTVLVTDGDKSAELSPYEGYRATFNIDFDHPAFEHQPTRASIEMSTTLFMREVARARTFGFKRDIERLRSMNLALGGSMDNAIVVDDTGVANRDGLRFKDEFVKHKLLDAIGDLYLIGASLIGEYRGFKSGHAMNNQLARALLASPESFEIVTQEEFEKAEELLEMAG
jgi:UDP-3-O-[3-hydroxymyristoyl] N-acetylglucosamine deacetylase